MRRFSNGVNVTASTWKSVCATCSVTKNIGADVQGGIAPANSNYSLNTATYSNIFTNAGSRNFRLTTATNCKNSAGANVACRSLTDGVATIGADMDSLESCASASGSTIQGVPVSSPIGPQGNWTGSLSDCAGGAILPVYEIDLQVIPPGGAGPVP
jgi:hypothetical protein